MFTEIRFKPDWDNNEIVLTDRGGGIYGVTLNASDLVSGLLDNDVNRKFVGFLRAYNGSILDSQFNMFVDVLTSSIPNVTPMQLDGDVQTIPHLFNIKGTYDTSIETVTKKFYQYYGDFYDFINIIYDEGRFLNRYHFSVSNNVQNIGVPIFDNAAFYGSKGRLKGISVFPIPGFFDTAEPGFLHEISHQWVNYLSFEPLSWGIPHWPLSTLASEIMGWGTGQYTQGLWFPYRIVPIDSNSWRLVADKTPKVYSDLSLYLMGLIPSGQVGTHTIFNNQNQPWGDGEIWYGPVTYISGSDVVSNMGERIPNYQDSQKIFNVATILVTKDGLAKPEQMQLYDWFASRAALTQEVEYHTGFEKGISRPFYLATGGKAQIVSALNGFIDTVQEIYIGYYQRPADPGGLIYWANRLDGSGGNLNEIIEAFANSPESQALYGTINSSNISTVVNGIYNALFGRDAEAGGLSYYVNGFNSGQFTAATIMLNVLYGAQNEDLVSVKNKVTAANLFTSTIDPELDGRDFQVTYAGDSDAIAGRNFLNFVTWDSATVPTQDETTAYIKTNIANPGDPILNP
jgi:hypothetical protein